MQMSGKSHGRRPRIARYAGTKADFSTPRIIIKLGRRATGTTFAADCLLPVIFANRLGRAPNDLRSCLSRFSFRKLFGGSPPAVNRTRGKTAAIETLEARLAPAVDFAALGPDCGVCTFTEPLPIASNYQSSALVATVTTPSSAAALGNPAAGSDSAKISTTVVSTPAPAANPAISAVNTQGLDLAIAAGVEHLTNILDANDGNIPFFAAWALTQAQAQQYGDAGLDRPATTGFVFDRHFVSNVSGNALAALLAGAQSLGEQIPAEAYDALRTNVLKSLHKPRNGNWADPNPANQMVTGLAADPAGYSSDQFDTTYLYNMGAGLRGAMALATLGPDPFATIPGYAWSARHVFEQSVDNIRRYYVYDKTLGGPRAYDWEQFRYQLGLRGGDANTASISTDLVANWSNLWKAWADPFLILDLVDYYEATGHQPSLELAKELRDLGFNARFPRDAAAVPISSFTHMHEVVAEMNAYSRLALVLGDTDMMDRIRVRYEVLRDQAFGNSGWTPETLGASSDVGDASNTAQLIETALNFAAWGWTQYYGDVERFTRGSLLPSQLLDTRFVTPNLQPTSDAERDVPARLRGAFGLSAPYGAVATQNPYNTGEYFSDTTAAAVQTLVEVKNAAYAYRNGVHQINLLFDFDNPQIAITSPYATSGRLQVTTKIAGDIRIRLPAWTDRSAAAASLGEQQLVFEFSADTLIVHATSPVDFHVDMPLAGERQIELINGRPMTIEWRGDSVAAMSRMGAPIPFFPDISASDPTPAPSDPGAEAIAVTATSLSSTQIVMGWEGALPPGSVYIVSIARADRPSEAISAVDVGLNTSHVFGDLDPATRYMASVQARDSSNALSPAVMVTLQTLPAETINTFDLDRAIAGGISHLADIQDPANGNLPYFYVWALTQQQAALYGDSFSARNANANMAFNPHFVSNISGRALYAMLLGADTLGIELPQSVVDDYETLVLKSLHKPRNGDWNDPDPANQMVTGLAADPRSYGTTKFDFTYLFNMGAGMLGALGMAALDDELPAVLPGYAWSARHVFEQAVDNIRRYYVYNQTIGGTRVYDWEQFRYQLGLTGGSVYTDNLLTETQSNWSSVWNNWADPFLVYSLVKYYEATGHGPTLELAKELRDLSFTARFPLNPAVVPLGSFTHMHEVMGEMAAYSRLALVTGDADMMNRVRVRYERLRDRGFVATGWVPETLGANSDVGELNNTGLLIETALNFAQFGWTQYYGDAERFTRGQLLPAQLLDTSFVVNNANPSNDGQRDIADRVRGAFGFPAPYGAVATKNPYYTGGYYTDVTAGAVISLSEVRKATYHFNAGVHEVNMLFDLDNEQITIASPYPNGDRLTITTKVAGDLRVRIPSWANRIEIASSLAAQQIAYQFDGDFLRIAGVAAGRAIAIAMPLPTQRQTMVVNSRPITVQWRGDSVAAMSRMNTPMPFFPAI
jgi:hypothetical protein